MKARSMAILKAIAAHGRPLACAFFSRGIKLNPLKSGSGSILICPDNLFGIRGCKAIILVVLWHPTIDGLEIPNNWDGDKSR